MGKSIVVYTYSVLFLVVSPFCFAYDIVRVPEDQPTFQAALDAIELPGKIVLGEGETVTISSNYTMPTGLSISGKDVSSATLDLQREISLRNNNILSNLNIVMGRTGVILFNRAEQSYIIGCTISGLTDRSTNFIFEDLNSNSGIMDCRVNNVGIDKDSQSIIQNFQLTNNSFVYNGRSDSNQRLDVQGMVFDSCHFLFFTARRNFYLGTDHSFETPTEFNNCILINATNTEQNHIVVRGSHGNDAFIRNCFISGEEIMIYNSTSWSLTVESSILRNAETALQVFNFSNGVSGTIQLNNNLFQDVLTKVGDRGEWGTVTEVDSVDNGSNININVNDITYSFTPDSSLVGAGLNGRDIGPVQLKDLQGPKVTKLNIHPVIIDPDLNLNVSIEGEPTSN